MLDNKEKKHSGFLSLANLKDILIICLIVIFTWKLLNSDISISIKELAFTDLVSILMAFFAIALSVTFYFKATETSNRFYDNSYKFTKEISEILGRIEAGFGEKLKHIDEGYSGIRDKFEKFPFDIASAKEEVEAEKEEIEKKQKEQGDLLENLAQRAQLAESEKEEVFNKMAKTSEELEFAKRDLRRMQRNIIDHEVSSTSMVAKDRILSYLKHRFDAEVPRELKRPLSSLKVRRIFSSIKNDLPPEAIDDLLNTGFMDDEGEISKKFIEALNEQIRIQE